MNKNEKLLKASAPVHERKLISWPRFLHTWLSSVQARGENCYWTHSGPVSRLTQIYEPLLTVLFLWRWEGGIYTIVEQKKTKKKRNSEAYYFPTFFIEAENIEVHKI